MNGFIEITYIDICGSHCHIYVHYTQIWFDGKYVMFQDKFIEESYEQIKALIKQATEL